MSANDERWRWVGAEIRNILEPHGLIKRGNSFVYQQTPEVVARIQIARPRFNPPGFERFSLILEVDIGKPEATRFTRDQRDHYMPVVIQDIAIFSGERGHEYALPEQVPSEQLAARLRGDLIAHVLPIIHRCSTLEGVTSVVDHLNRLRGENQFSMSLAIALARRGLLDESRTYFQQSMGDPEIVRQVARGFGITW